MGRERRSSNATGRLYTSLHKRAMFDGALHAAGRRHVRACTTAKRTCPLGPTHPPQRSSAGHAILTPSPTQRTPPRSFHGAARQSRLQGALRLHHINGTHPSPKQTPGPDPALRAFAQEPTTPTSRDALPDSKAEGKVGWGSDQKGHPSLLCDQGEHPSPLTT